MDGIKSEIFAMRIVRFTQLRAQRRHNVLGDRNDRTQNETATSDTRTQFYCCLKAVGMVAILLAAFTSNTIATATATIYALKSPIRCKA